MPLSRRSHSSSRALKDCFRDSSWDRVEDVRELWSAPSSEPRGWSSATLVVKASCPASAQRLQSLRFPAMRSKRSRALSAVTGCIPPPRRRSGLGRRPVPDNDAKTETSPELYLTALSLVMAVGVVSLSDLASFFGDI